MVTAVNDCDVKLQATNPRLNPVTLPPNVTIPPTSVPGLPEYMTSAKAVDLVASTQLFQIAKSGTVTPTVTTLTASLRNLTGNPTWSVTGGTATLTTNPATPLTATLLESNMTSDTATIRAAYVDTSVVPNVTYYDEVTIVKVREGTDSISAFLTNEAHTLQADSSGTVASYANAVSQMKIFVGITDVTASGWTFSRTASTGVTASITTGGLCSVTAMSVDSGYVDISAAKTGFTTITKRFTLAKSKAGANGANGGTGPQGARGTVNVSAATAGTVWSNSEAVAAISAAGYGAPQARDIVTLHKAASGFSETRFYDGTNWLILSAYVNGNMVINGTLSGAAIIADTIEGTAIKADAIKVGHIDVAELSGISATLGTITSALIRSGTVGERTETTQYGGKVYDAANTLRLAWGKLT